MALVSELLQVIDQRPLDRSGGSFCYLSMPRYRYDQTFTFPDLVLPALPTKFKGDTVAFGELLEIFSPVSSCSALFKSS